MKIKMYERPVVSPGEMKIVPAPEYPYEPAATFRPSPPPKVFTNKSYQYASSGPKPYDLYGQLASIQALEGDDERLEAISEAVRCLYSSRRKALDTAHTNATKAEYGKRWEPEPKLDANDQEAKKSC